MNIKFSKIKNLAYQGEENTIDLEVDHLDHNFYAEGIVTSNSHATGYAYLTATTCYLKANHPLEYFCSLLNASKNEQKPLEEIRAIQKELAYFNIKLLPPDILKSDLDFKIEGPDIRFGLGHIKSVSDKTIEKLNNFRHQFSNKFEIFMGAEEAGLNITVLSALIQAGCLDEQLTQNRRKTVAEAYLWRILTDREKKFIISYINELGFDLNKIVKILNETKKDEKGKPIIKDSRLKTISRNFEPAKETYKENGKLEKIVDYWHERKVLGFSYSYTLSDIYQEIYKDMYELVKISKLKKMAKYEYVTVAAIVEDTKQWVSKNEKKTNCFRLLLSDEDDSTCALIFNDKIDEIMDLNGSLPKKEDLVIIKGKWMGDAIFADVVSVQKNYTRYNPNPEKKTKKVLQEA